MVYMTPPLERIDWNGVDLLGILGNLRHPSKTSLQQGKLIQTRNLSRSLKFPFDVELKKRTNKSYRQITKLG